VDSLSEACIIGIYYRSGSDMSPLCIILNISALLTFFMPVVMTYDEAMEFVRSPKPGYKGIIGEHAILSNLQTHDRYDEEGMLKPYEPMIDVNVPLELLEEQYRDFETRFLDAFLHGKTENLLKPSDVMHLKDAQIDGTKIDGARTDGLRIVEQPPRGTPDGSAQCMLTLSFLSKLEEMPKFPAPILRHPKGEKVFEIKQCSDPARGLGMFARKDLDIGDLVLAERPLLVVRRGYIMLPPNHPVYDGLRTREEKDQANQKFWRGLVESLVDRMDDGKKAAFFALGDCKKKTGEEPSIYGRVETNAYGLNGMTDNGKLIF
jgi:hypothetical protein